MIAQAHQTISAGVQRRACRLPERLGRQWRTLLLCGDVAVVLFVSTVVLDGDGNRFAAAVLACAIIVGIFWCCRLYRRSFAVTPMDEAYYACAGMALAAIPVALLLAVLGSFTLLSIALTLVFCTVGTSALRVRLHLERRSSITVRRIGFHYAGCLARPRIGIVPRRKANVRRHRCASGDDRLHAGYARGRGRHHH